MKTISAYRHIGGSRRAPVLSVLLCAVLAAWPAHIAGAAAAATLPRGDATGAAVRPDATGLAFEPNAGQTDPAVRFLARSRDATLFFTSGEVALLLPAPGGGTGSPESRGPRSTAQVLRLGFVGANAAPRITGVGQLPGVVNYLRGNDPAAWRTGLPTYAGIRYDELYPGIALAYAGRTGNLKGTYEVAPGADPHCIRWQYTGVDGVSLAAMSGDLQIHLPGSRSDLVERAPTAWQTIRGERVPVSAAYTIADDGTIGLALGPYDRGLTLTIDPELQYSTYLGGSGYDQGLGTAVDAQGNAYIAGYTTSTDFPSANPLQENAAGMSDAFVVKLNSGADTRIFATYIGGTKDDTANGIAIDSVGNIVVAGFTKSPDWPLAGAIQSTLATPNGEGFLIKLTPMGSGVIFSTYLGGIGGAVARGVAVDVDGNIYVTGSAGSDFPLVAPYQSVSHGDDAFIAKLNPGGNQLVYSTYLGGPNGSHAFGIAVDGAGRAFVAGHTLSPNFPVVNPYQAACVPLPGYTNCSRDAFVSALSADGSALVYSTYLGSSGADSVHAIAVDEEGNIVVAGATDGTDFPRVNAAQPTYGGGRSDAFVTKFSAGGAPVFSTYLGGNHDEDYFGAKSGIAVDAEGRITVVGDTASTDFPVLNALKSTLRSGNTNGFVTQYTTAGQLVFSSYLGSDKDLAGASGVAADSEGNVYITGSSRANNFPTTPGVVQPGFGGGVTDAYALKINLGPGIALRFSPANLTFGEQESGSTSPAQTIVATNVSPAPVSISIVALVGANPLDFAIKADGCAGRVLASGGTCQLAVTFSPRASGMRYARIVLSGPGWGATRNIPLRGKGAPTVTLSPEVLQFPLAKRFSTSLPLTETLTNVGLEPLLLSTVTLTGTNKVDFNIFSDSCGNQTIPAGSSCTVVLVFTPQGEGSRFAQLRIASAVFDAPATVPLSGTCGNTPELTVDRAEFGVCEGLPVRVRGVNFPSSGGGEYRVFFDGAAVFTGTVAAGGRFDEWIQIPRPIGTSHVISASATSMPALQASVPVRSPGTDLPVILLPGVSASYIDAAADFGYMSPPDPNLALPFPDTRQLLPWTNAFFAGQHVWIDWLGVTNAFAGNYRYIDALQFDTDGMTPKKDMLGRTPPLQVGTILWDVNLGVLDADFFKTFRQFLLDSKNADGSHRYTDTGPNRNLYYFPFDWRKDVRTTGADLDAMINMARFTSGKDKVALVAHSMGGLVSRNYLLNYGTSKVDQLITLGTPYLGSVLVAKVLEMGDNWGLGFFHGVVGDFGIGMHPKQMMKLAQNFPSSYGLLPAAQYFTRDAFDVGFDPHYIDRQTVTDFQAHLEPLNYADSIAFLGQRHNGVLNAQAETYRNQGIGDFSLLRGQLFHERIMGVNLPTIGRMGMTPRQVCANLPLFGLQCVSLPEFAFVLMNVYGDNTVPLRSAMGANWRKPDGTSDNRYYWLSGVGHVELTTNPTALALVDMFLKGTKCDNPCLRPDPPPECGAPGARSAGAMVTTAPSMVTSVQVAAVGAATLSAYDSQGRLTGAVPGKPYAEKSEIPGSGYTTSDGGQFIALEQSGVYTLTLHGMGPAGAALLRIDTLQDGSVTRSTIFDSIPLTTTTAATVTLTLPGPVVGDTLTYTYDASSPVREAAKLPLLSGDAAQDRLPPVTQISVGANRQVTLTATDAGGSGVRRILYSTDGGAHYQVYTGPFAFTGCVTAVAEDWAGNAEYPAAALPCVRVYLPLVLRQNAGDLRGGASGPR